MGKKFALTYANIFIAGWEEQALQTVPKQPSHYFRYLDDIDIWGVWSYLNQDFERFVNTLNGFNASIK